jgi:hypothetical protein
MKSKDQLPTEEHEQIVFVTWVKKQGYRIVAIPNGGARHIITGFRLKQSGVSAGFPDLFVPIVTHKYHGMFLEIKRQKGGKVSDSQLEWLSFLRSAGYYAEVAEGAEQAKKMFSDYISFGLVS